MSSMAEKKLPARNHVHESSVGSGLGIRAATAASRSGDPMVGPPIIAARAARKDEVMKLQSWRGSVFGVVASLSLFGLAGAGVARAEDVTAAEPYFEVAPEAVDPSESVTVAEPSFEVAPQQGEAFAEVNSQSEPYFEVAPETGEAYATGSQQQQESKAPLSLKGTR